MWYVDKRKFVIISSVLCIFCAVLLSFYRNNICLSDAAGEKIANERINVEHREQVSEQRISNERLNNQLKCWRKLGASDRNYCRPRCENGSFSLLGFDQCVPWLNCHDLKHVELVRQINQGAVKKVYLGLWKGYYVAVSVPTLDVGGTYQFEADLRHGLQMLIGLGPGDHVTQLIGFCSNPLTIVTEYHEFGSVDRFREILENDALLRYDTPQLRFRLCCDYVGVLSFLHSSPLGVRVMCDSNDLKKTLEQYLLTQDFRLIVNDLDAAPEVNRGSGRLIKCGRRQLSGSFVAPEQKWPYPHLPFHHRSMPAYDEKTDVWKIPDVCHAFLHRQQDDLIRFHLFSIHKKCKSMNPQDRPSARQVLDVYSEVWSQLFTSTEE